MKSRYLKLYLAYSISFNSSNAGRFFLEWILKACIKVQEKKKKVVGFVHVFNKTWNQALSRCSRAATAKKCTKKHGAKLLPCQSKPIAFFAVLVAVAIVVA